MSDYRRNYQAGGTYFFTVVMYKRQRIFNDDAVVELLREAFKAVRAELPFTIDAMVILPDHLHCIWTLQEHDTDFSTRWKKIKTHFTKTYKRRMGGDIMQPTKSMQSKGEIGLWQRRFWEHTIRDDNDYRRHCDYIHYNPVKHGLVDTAAAWKYSSFSRFVERGIYDNNWAGSEDDLALLSDWE